VAAHSGESIHDLVAPLLDEFQLVADLSGPAPYERSPDHPNGAPSGTTYVLLLAGSRAQVDLNADVAALEGDVLLVETKPKHSKQAGTKLNFFIINVLLFYTFFKQKKIKF